MKFRFLADDFTGASDVLLQCRKNGMDAAIVANLDSDTRPESFDGIASTARSMSPAQLSEYLPSVLESFHQIGTDILLYKVCSTFDSSPEIGSIGHTVTMIRESMPVAGPVTVVPAQPAFGRFTAFGHHFSASGDEVYRLDRHPVMRNHPTTPMRESDLRRILAEQGIDPTRIAHIPFTDLRSQQARLRQLLAEGDNLDVIVVDAIEETDLDIVSRDVMAARQDTDQLIPIIGSGGIAGALARAYGDEQVLQPRAFASGAALVLSGSRSPVTQGQIETALSSGWEGISLDRDELLTQRLDSAAELGRIVELLQADRSVVVSIDDNTSSGTEADPTELVRASGRLFANLIRTSVEQIPHCRIAVLGGDTSSWTVSNLNPSRIQVAAAFVQAGPILNIQAPGIPSYTPFLLKGGQVGAPDTLTKFAAL